MGGVIVVLTRSESPNALSAEEPEAGAPSSADVPESRTGGGDSDRIATIPRPWAEPAPPTVDPSQLGEAPSSLRGTQVPDVLHADDDGHLIVTSDMPALFDYYMTTFGEEDAEFIAARIQAEIERRLPPSAAEEALVIATQYADFRTGAPQARLNLRAADDWASISMSERMERWQEARRSFFSEDVGEAFFEQRETAEDYAAARAEIAFDTTLTDAEKQGAYQQLLDSLPDDMGEQIQSRGRMSRLHNEVIRLRSEGASATTIHAARVTAVGELMTAQLEQLDWQRGIQDP